MLNPENYRERGTQLLGANRHAAMGNPYRPYPFS